MTPIYYCGHRIYKADSLDEDARDWRVIVRKNNREGTELQEETII